MLAKLVGQVDLSSAAVLVAAIVCACIVVTALIAKRRSKQELANEFALAKMKQRAENDREMYAVETDRSYKFKQLDKNLITSHRSE